jgi:hypothetical protein
MLPSLYSELQAEVIFPLINLKFQSQFPDSALSTRLIFGPKNQPTFEILASFQPCALIVLTSSLSPTSRSLPPDQS